MQPGSFSFLLAALLFAIAQVEAVPVNLSPRMVTMPLTRLPRRSDVPPSILLQQHINRGHRRHARMNGVLGPSDAELVKRMEKRLYQARYDKRYSRPGISALSENITILNDPGNSTSPNQNSTSPNQNSTTPNQGFPLAGLQAQQNGNVTKANPPTGNNSLGLDVEGDDLGYFATIQAGTPLRNFSLIMDSGSSDFWIGGEGCISESGGDCGNHVFLGPNSSSSFQDSGKNFQVTYGSGQVAGNIISDNVNLAGFTLNNHTFGVALVESQDFTNNSLADGLMGLAKSPLSQQGVITPVESLAKQGSISEAITSYKLSRTADGLNDGEITFGGLDQSKFDPKTAVTVDNVNALGFWEAPMNISVNGQDLGLTGRTSILDTGTTLIIAPSNDVTAVHAKIPGAKSDGQGGFTIPCTNTAVLSMTFGGQQFDINPLDLLFTPVDPNNLQGECISALAAGQIGGPLQWLAGDVFLKNAYYSTNVDKNTITLAKLV